VDSLKQRKDAKIIRNLPSAKPLANEELGINLERRQPSPERLKTKESLVTMEVSKNGRLEQISKVM